MRTARDLLDELNSLDESARIEAKRGSEVDRSIQETICAFANEPGLDGGYLLLGVQAKETLFDLVYEPEGLPDPDKIQADIVTACSSVFNRPIRPQVTVEDISGKRLVVAYIPEASPTDKPVYLKRLGLPRGAFRRLGPTDHEGTDDDLITLYAGHQVETYDTTAIGDGTMADIDPAAIAEYRALRAKVNPSAEELNWSDDDLLRAFGCIKTVDGRTKPTVAGILLFGTAIALRRCFPMMRVDYIRVPGKEWVEDPDHRFDTIEIRAPLISAVRRAQNSVLDDIPKSFSLPSGDIQSREIPIMPERVVREAVVNAAMHRSYKIHGAIQIIRYANRLEIRNPGHSLKAEDRLGEPGSETRNPRIAAVLHELNIAETKGSGIRVMREMMQQSNLLPPTFESSRRPDQFVATFLFHHFLEADDVAWLKELSDEPFSDEEARALVFVREIGAIDNAAYREINRADTLDASTHLRRLRKIDLLVKKGSGNRTYYVPGPGFLASLAPAESRKPVAESAQPKPESRKLGPQSRKLPAELTTEHLPDDLATKVASLPKRPSQKKLRDMIGQLCAWQPMNSVQLSHLLGRKREPLVRDHLKPMVSAGQLAYTIPEMPNHPDQAYTIPTTEPG
jgi:ATP-dependent DNA helicase RecG